MKKSEFLRCVRQRMFDLKVSHEKAAECLHMTQPTFSRKMAGKSPFTYEEAEGLKDLLGLSTPSDAGVRDAVDPRPGMITRVLVALPDADQRLLCAWLVWGIEEKESRLKPEGLEAFRALRALS